LNQINSIYQVAENFNLYDTYMGGMYRTPFVKVSLSWDYGGFMIQDEFTPILTILDSETMCLDSSHVSAFVRRSPNPALTRIPSPSRGKELKD